MVAEAGHETVAVRAYRPRDLMGIPEQTWIGISRPASNRMLTQETREAPGGSGGERARIYRREQLVGAEWLAVLAEKRLPVAYWCSWMDRARSATHRRKRARVGRYELIDNGTANQ